MLHLRHRYLNNVFLDCARWPATLNEALYLIAAKALDKTRRLRRLVLMLDSDQVSIRVYVPSGFNIIAVDFELRRFDHIITVSVSTASLCV